MYRFKGIPSTWLKKLYWNSGLQTPRCPLKSETYSLSLTDVWPAPSRPFTGRQEPNFMGRWRMDAEISLSHCFLWQPYCCHGIQQKPSCGSYIWVMIRNFGISSRIAYTGLHTENEHILPCGSRDRHIATCLTTLFSSVALSMHDDVTRISSRAASLWRHSDQGRSPEYAKFWIFKIGP